MIVPTFVDLQGFNIGQRFIVKEVAVLRKGNVLTHYIFKSPMPWKFLTHSDKSRISWLIKNHHGLSWENGTVPFNMAKQLITTAITDMDGDEVSRFVYVKGYEKRMWLVDMLGADVGEDYTIETLDADYEDVESLNVLDTIGTMRCGNHFTHCALQNVLKIFNWWTQRQKELQ